MSDNLREAALDYHRRPVPTTGLCWNMSNS